MQVKGVSERRREGGKKKKRGGWGGEMARGRKDLQINKSKVLSISNNRKIYCLRNSKITKEERNCEVKPFEISVNESVD